MNDRPFRIFLSSTFSELIEERRAVESTIHRIGDMYDGMEHFGSSPNIPLSECLRRVAECDFMVLLLGLSYGSKPDGYEKSFTELEFEEADKLGKAILVYCADERTYGLKRGCDPELAKFRQRLKNSKIHSLFVSPHDLALKVASDLGREARSEIVRLEADARGSRALQHDQVVRAILAGDYDSARELNGDILRRYPRSPRGNYNQACVLTRLAGASQDAGSRAALLSAATVHLEKARDCGFLEFIERYGGSRLRKGKQPHNYILKDPDLSLLFKERPDLQGRLAPNPPPPTYGPVCSFG